MRGRVDGGRVLRDTVEINTTGTDPNSPLAYVLVLDHHHLNMSKLGGHGSQLEREREINISF